MNLTDLQYFSLVAQSGSFSHGAILAHVSAPAMSKAIQRLEESLGTPLFVRTTRRVTLTSAGHLMLQRAQRIIREVDDARVALDQMQGTMAGPLRIGANEVFSVGLIPSALAQLVDEADAVRPELFEMLPQTIYEHLRDGQIDIGFTIGGSSGRTVSCEPIGLSRGVLVCGRDHALYAAGRVSAKSLREHRSAVPKFWGESAMSTFDQFDDNAYPRRVGATIELLQSAVELAVSGRFLAYLPEIAVRRYLSEGALKALRGLHNLPTFDLQVMVRADSIIKPSALRLRQIVAQLIKAPGAH